MNLQTIKVKCGGCGAILEVTNSRNEDVKRFNCPNCGKAIEVPFYRLFNDNGKTQLGHSGGSDATQLGGVNVACNACRLLLDGKPYDLEVGVNSVGRLSSSIKIDVPLKTEDRTMSRQHAIINVCRLRDGGIKSVITNDKNKNDTSVNGMVLQPGDAIVLKDGDRIKMGNTTVTFRYT